MSHVYLIQLTNTFSYESASTTASSMSARRWPACNWMWTMHTGWPNGYWAPTRSLWTYMRQLSRIALPTKVKCSSTRNGDFMAPTTVPCCPCTWAFAQRNTYLSTARRPAGHAAGYARRRWNIKTPASVILVEDFAVRNPISFTIKGHTGK